MIQDFLKHYHPEVLRYFSLMSHYRSPIDYARDNIDAASRGLSRLYTALRGFSFSSVVPEFEIIQTSFEQKFKDAMNDDFNTPEAIAILFEIAHEINRQRDIDPKKAIVLAACLNKLGNLLGLLYSEPEIFLQSVQGGMSQVSFKFKKLKFFSEKKAGFWPAFLGCKTRTLLDLTS